MIENKNPYRHDRGFLLAGVERYQLVLSKMLLPAELVYRSWHHLSSFYSSESEER